MIGPPQLKAPRAATPGPGLSSRSRASYGLWVTYSATPLKAGTPAGAVERCPTLKPFSPNAAVSVSQASASVPATGAMNCMIARFAMRLCLTGMALDAVAAGERGVQAVGLLRHAARM